MGAQCSGIEEYTIWPTVYNTPGSPLSKQKYLDATHFDHWACNSSAVVIVVISPARALVSPSPKP